MDITEHSSAYKDFYHQLNATGMERAYGGFAPDTLDRIFDWERDEVEKTVWLRFKSTGDEKLREGMLSSEYSGRMISVAAAAYEATSIEDYLDYIFEYYDKKHENSALATLSYLKPCNKLYDFFKTVYLSSDDCTARSTAVDGMLCCRNDGNRCSNDTVSGTQFPMPQ